jgi:hypothetical protein
LLDETPRGSPAPVRGGEREPTPRAPSTAVLTDLGIEFSGDSEMFEVQNLGKG